MEGMHVDSVNPGESMDDRNPQGGQGAELVRMIEDQNRRIENLEKILVNSMIMDSYKENKYYLRVKVADFDMGMGSMVGFMFKWLIASIPVGIIVGILYALFFGIFLY